MAQHLISSLILLFLITTSLVSAHRTHCKPGWRCWPTPHETTKLANALGSAPRSYWWAGAGNPLPGAVGVNSTVANQPLYGFGQSLQGLYVRNLTHSLACFSGNLSTETNPFCLASTRNNPIEGQPAFTAFPLTVSHVQILNKFARKHRLSVCVAGTGHDFLNRHTCNNGLFIRTSLFKQKVFDAATNTVKFGIGVTFSEGHQFLNSTGRMMVSGWSPTVGVAGWSLGGGHGFYAPKWGLGSSQIVSAEIVTSDGKLLVASNTSHRDLWLAIRGGGGSVFGVLTSLTIQTHPLPVGGFTYSIAIWSGNLCNGTGTLNNTIAHYLNWSSNLDQNWGGLFWITMTYAQPCVRWQMMVLYHYQGAPTDIGFTSKWAEILQVVPASGYRTFYGYKTPWSTFGTSPAEVITPVPYLAPSGSFAGGVPSVLITRDKFPELKSAIQSQFDRCNATRECPRLEFYHDLAGNVGSTATVDTSLNPGMKDAIFHLVFREGNVTDYYKIGPYSYFSESAWNLDDWKARLFGDQYSALLKTKRKYDWQDLFHCRHCVGDRSH